MRQVQFEKRYESRLLEFEALLAIKPREKVEDAKHFLSLYEEICHLQAIARGRQYSIALTDRLDRLVSAGHARLYQRRDHYAGRVLNFIVSDFPRLLRKEYKVFWLAFFLFYGPLCAVMIAGWINNDMPISIMGSEQAQELEIMYEPSLRTVGEARESSSNWLMFGFYIRNNIGIAFRSFASGVLLMVGSVFITVYNGLVIGAAGSHMVNVGFIETFYGFVVGHGSFELTGIIIACAAGLKLGIALLMPGQLSRVESLKQNGRIAIQLMFGVFIMLLIAAFVEAFWSSNNVLPFLPKLIIGLFGWVLLAWYLLRAGKRYRLDIE